MKEEDEVLGLVGSLVGWWCRESLLSVRLHKDAKL